MEKILYTQKIKIIFIFNLFLNYTKKFHDITSKLAYHLLMVKRRISIYQKKTQADDH